MMPFKSDAQRRWMFKNRPDIARKWAKNYKDGGFIEADPVINMCEGGYVEPAQSFVDGGLVVYREEGGETFKLADYRKSLALMDEPELHELATNMGQPITYRNGKPIPRDDLEYKMGVKVWKQHNDPKTILEWIPVVGDILMAQELLDAIKAKDWLLVGILGGAAAIGVIPGVGDAVAAVIKKAAKVIAKVPQQIRGQVASAIGTASKNGRPIGPIIDDVSKLFDEWEGSADDLNAIKQRFNELMAKHDERFGTEPVFRDVGDYSDAHTTKGSDGAVVHIPGQIRNIHDASVLMEEMYHATDEFIDWTQDVAVQSLNIEARAKLDVLKSGVKITKELSDEILESYQNYVRAVISKIHPYIANGKLTKAEAVKAIDNMPDADDEFFKLLGWTPFSKDELKKLIADDEPFTINNRGEITIGARVATKINFYIKTPDGNVSTHFLTPADFRELTGIGVSAVKKSGGRIKANQAYPDGAQWSKNPDDFPEFKTGQTVAEGEFIDPSTVTFKEAGDKARRLPQSLDNVVRAAIRKKIDDAVFPHFKQKVDDILANPQVTRDYDFELDEWIETADNEGFNSITGWRNGTKNKELSREISDTAWNDVVGAMEEYKEFGADAWNKIINYAKQQSSYLFSFKMPAKMSKGAQKAADQAGNPYTAEATKHQGIMARAGKDPELEFQKNYKNAAESGSSDAIRFLLREAEGLRTTLTVGASNPFQAQRFVGIPMEEIAADLKLLDQAIIDINTTEIDRLLKKYDVGTTGYNSGGYVNPLISY